MIFLSSFYFGNRNLLESSNARKYLNICHEPAILSVILFSFKFKILGVTHLEKFFCI